MRRSESGNDGQILFNDITFTLKKGDKVAVISRDHTALSTFFEILNGEDKQDSGDYTWGTTITRSYLPNDNSKFFDSDLNLIDWLRQYSKDKDETYIRGFLGNCLILDEPTNHLDLESITAFNNALKDWKHVALFTSHDHEFMHTVANRIIELTPNGIIDKSKTYDEYLEDERVKEMREKMYDGAMLTNK